MKKLLLFAGAFLLTSPLFAWDWDVYKYAQLTSTATVAVGACKLHAVTITGTAAQAFVIYDSTSSNQTSVVISSFSASTAAGTYIFDVQVQNGIQINSAGNGPQVTVSYR